jgi:thiamine biosynthesis lipoprotein
LDDVVSAVTLPEGVRLDLGGVAKGAAADLVAEELMATGCAGCCVNVGGDLRVVGQPPKPGGWTVALASPGGGRRRTVVLADGGVCTSTKLFRRWTSGAGPQHHLRDPATGRPVAGQLDSVTVVGAGAAQAEIVAIAIYVAGPAGAAAIADRFGLTGQLVVEGGGLLDLPGLDRFLARGDTVTADV